MWLPCQTKTNRIPYIRSFFVPLPPQFHQKSTSHPEISYPVDLEVVPHTMATSGEANRRQNRRRSMNVSSNPEDQRPTNRQHRLSNRERAIVLYQRQRPSSDEESDEQWKDGGQSNARRASFDMEIDDEDDVWGDEHDPVIQEKHMEMITERLGILREDLLLYYRSGSVVLLKIHFRRAELEKKYLYRDAGDLEQTPAVNEPHVQLNQEIDPWRGPYWTTDLDRELQRAYKLSLKPIKDAPPSTLDLPWDKISNHATIEEMLVYFPNHVARWPGLAVALRWTNWERLFYRAARIINLARGTHQRPNREDLHTEVLPLQIKVERAIRELSPDYNLWDYDHVSIEPHIKDYLHTRPQKHNQRVNIICTLEEAASYMTGINEFQEYSPFSQMMKQYHPLARRPALSPVVPNVPDGLGNLHAYYQYRAETGESFTGWPAPEPEPPFDMCWNVPCDDLDCRKTHQNSHEYQSWLRGTNGPSEPASRNPSNGSASQYHATSDLFEENDNYEDGRIMECPEKAGCSNSSCGYGHRGPWTGTGVHLSFDMWCRDDVRCTTQTCANAHKSWAHLENGKGPAGNINATNGDVHQAKWQIPCTANPCNKANCWFGHRGPRTKANVQPNFDMEPRCSYDLGCKSPKCNKAHSSPAQLHNGGHGVGAESFQSNRSNGTSRRTQLERGRANRDRGDRGDWGGRRGRGGRGGREGREGREDRGGHGVRGGRVGHGGHRDHGVNEGGGGSGGRGRQNQNGANKRGRHSRE